MTKKLAPHVVIGRSLLEKVDVDTAIQRLGELIVDGAHEHGFYYKKPPEGQLANPEGYSALSRKVLRYLKGKRSAQRREASARHASHTHESHRPKPKRVENDAPIGLGILRLLRRQSGKTIESTLGSDCD